MSQSETFAKCPCQHCGGHMEFPADAAGQKISCPHCGKPTLLFLTQTERKRGIPVLAMVAGVLLAVGPVAYFYYGSRKSPEVAAAPKRPVALSNGSSTGVGPPPKPKPPPDPWHGLKAGAVTLEKAGDSSLVYAIGSLTNATPRQRFGVKVTVDVLDEHRNKIGAATDYIEVIEPGKTWKFRALLTDKNAKAAKLMNVTEQE